MSNFPPRKAKNFTEEESHAARVTGRFDAENGKENQSRRGVYSGIARRQISLEKAIAGSTSPKTLKTSVMNLICTGTIMKEYPSDHGLILAFAKLCETMKPFDAMIQISEKVQRLQASIARFQINTWDQNCHWSDRSPAAVFEHICEQASELADKLLAKFRLFLASTNHLNTQSTAKEEQTFSQTKHPETPGARAMQGKPSTPLRLPSDLYSTIVKTASKMLSKVDMRQITAKLGDCFKKNDHQRFEYILGEASKGRSIFAKTGKFNGTRTNRQCVIDHVAGKNGFLSKYGVAFDEKVGFLYA